MRIFRPGLPTIYDGEPEPVSAIAPKPAHKAPPVLTPEMASALADARLASLTRAVPGNVTQPKPGPLRNIAAGVELIPPPAGADPMPDPAPPIPAPIVPAAPTATPVEPKPAVQPQVVRPARKPGTIPEHMKTGGHEPRTQAGARK